MNCPTCGNLCEGNVITPQDFKNIRWEKFDPEIPRVTAWIKPTALTCASDLQNALEVANPAYDWTISSVIVFKDETSICFIGRFIGARK